MKKTGKSHAAALLAVALVALTLGTAPAGAQQTAAGAAPIKRQATAVRLDTLPVFDGNVLGDPAWAAVQATEGFTQIIPYEGAEASERTDVRIAYTADTLYIGVICYDREASAITIMEGRRDSDLNTTDSFRVLLDTYNDRQNGFIFGTSPAGQEYDGQLASEGAGSGRGVGIVGVGQQAGSGGGFNLNWDGAWEVKTQVSEIGWSAEFAIPFRTLRYPSGDVQTWGINFQRDIRRRREVAFWSPLPRQFNLYRVSLAGQLTGMRVPPQRNLKVTPYVLGQGSHRTAERLNKGRGDVGGDLKYSITPSMTLDATYNTDFAQVEVDDEQVNLDRFALFYPEKRPFFLENAGLFSIGQAGQTEAFFSRRIGISPGGSPVSIVGGARLQGNMSGTNIGVLNMQTESADTTQPANNFLVARVRRDFPARRSNVGMMFANRQGTGKFAGDDNWQRTVATDGRVGIGQKGTISGYAISLFTPQVTEKEYAYSGTAAYDTQAVRMSLAYTEVTPSFAPQVGFVQRAGFRRVNASVFTTFRPDPKNRFKFLELRPHASHFTFWDYNTGLTQSQYTHIDNHWDFTTNDEIHSGMNITSERVTRPFEIFPGVIVPNGLYDHSEAQFAFWTSDGRPVSLRLDFVKGGYFGGKRQQYGPSVNIRGGDKLTSAISLSRNDIDLPVGAFVTNVVRTRLSYSFTPRLFLQALLQYNDRADLWSSNLRFAVLSQANTGLFVVYNDVQGLDDFVPRGSGRSLTIKYSRMFDLLN